MTRVLAIVSSDTTNGYWLSELSHPYWHLHEAGIEVQIASPAGPGAIHSPYSDPRNPESAEAGDLVSLGFLEWDPAHTKLDQAVPLTDVEVADYDGFWIVGGTGPVFDLHGNPDLDRVITDFWTAKKPLAAICHGVIGLATATDPSTGEPVVAGRDLTSFTVAEDQLIEAMLGTGRFLPHYPQEALQVAGANHSSREPAGVHVVRSGDGRILTGQNQQSATAFGLELAALFTEPR